MKERVRELEALLDPVRGGDDASADTARRVARALRGSGGSFGFQDVSDLAGLVERSPEGQLLRSLEGLVVVLRQTAWPDDPDCHATMRWLERVLSEFADGEALPSDVREAWSAMAERSGLTPQEMAERIATTYGLVPVEALAPTSAAVRLVPERLVQDRNALPLTEDGVEIVVAVADPTDLRTELELERVTGRSPVFRVAPPDVLRSSLDTLRGSPHREPRRPPDPSGTADAEARTVLVIDDDESARLLARTALERNGGFRILEAEDGQDGLDRFEEEPDVDLVVVDLDMPRLGGREVVRALRARRHSREPAVIVLTGAEDPLLEADLIEEGADDYLRKPLDPRLFLARVAATLRRAAR